MDQNKIFVASLPFSVTDEDLRAMFAPHGNVTSARVATDKFKNDRSKGFGFVEMETPEEAQAAIAALNGADCQGRALIVNIAKPREDKPRGGGFGGGNRSNGGGFRSNGGGGYRSNNSHQNGFRENNNSW